MARGVVVAVLVVVVAYCLALVCGATASNHPVNDNVPIHEWSVEEVCEWVSSLGFGQVRSLCVCAHRAGTWQRGAVW